MRWTFVIAGVICMSPARAGTVLYEGEDFPEDVGFQRVGTFDAARWLNDGWLYQHVELGNWAPPPGGQQDLYEMSLSEFAGEPFFIEWRIRTDAPNTEIDGVGGSSLSAWGGGILYHFTIAEDQVRLLRGVQFAPLWIDIEPGVAHTYRLELSGEADFTWQIDGQLIASGRPEGNFPNAAAYIIWGTTYHLAESTSSWDYLRFGTIPEPATAVLVLLGAGVLLRRRFARG